jgi:hypothetical protein
LYKNRRKNLSRKTFRASRFSKPPTLRCRKSGFCRAPVAVAAHWWSCRRRGKTEFTVVLTAAGDKKIEVIKEVRAITGLGLKEAKDLLKQLKGCQEGLNKADAEAAKKSSSGWRQGRVSN